MGVAACRRTVYAYRDLVFPRWKEELDLFLGFALPVDVRWDTFVGREVSVWCFQHLTEVYFLPLRYAIDQVAFDGLGRNALRDRITSVVVMNSDDNAYSESMARFEDGVLTIDHRPHSNIHELPRRTEAIRRCLEEHL